MTGDFPGFLARLPALDSTEQAALEYLRRQGIERAELLLTLGSGQRNPWQGECAQEIPYGAIPGWPGAGVPGHDGKLSLVRIGAQNLVVMSGRHHYYEARCWNGVARPLRLAAALGVRGVILTNSVGALRPGLGPGDLVLITGHLLSPGTNWSGLDGVANARVAGGVYWRQGGRLMCRAALEAGIPLTGGVLYYQPGPTYETRAEGRMAHRMGADLAAMSLAPEALLARRLGCRVVGLSLVTNMVSQGAYGASADGGCGHGLKHTPDRYAAGAGAGALHHDQVVAVAARYQPLLRQLLRRALPRLADAMSVPQE